MACASASSAIRVIDLVLVVVVSHLEHFRTLKDLPFTLALPPDFARQRGMANAFCLWHGIMINQVALT
jgi:hypothetical protein